MSHKLLIGIVPRDSGELIANAAKSAGAGGGTIVMGRGTASNGILQLLGLGDTSKDIVYIIIKESIKNAVCQAIINAAEKKPHFGVMFTLNTPDFFRAGHLDEKTQKEEEQASATAKSEGEEKMKAENNYQMINVIVNKGYAEDAMAAARKAGAGGGTIIGARGTAKEDDAAFFGMKIVPEKEMLMILVPAEKKAAIVEAISELPCFAQAGSGIIFCNEAQDFTLLGKK